MDLVSGGLAQASPGYRRLSDDVATPLGVGQRRMRHADIETTMHTDTSAFEKKLAAPPARLPAAPSAESHNLTVPSTTAPSWSPAADAGEIDFILRRDWYPSGVDFMQSGP